MLHSLEEIRYQIHFYQELRERHVSEIARIDSLLQELGWEIVANEAGDVISYADCVEM